MKTPVSILAALSLFIPPLFANSDMRKWEFKDGGSVRAEMTDYQEESGVLTLRKEDKTELKIDKTTLSPLDEAWLLQWVEFTEQTQALMEKLGGKLERKASTGQFPTEYSVYHPSGEKPAAGRPLLILFHPGGKGHRDILRYVEAAEAVKMTLVSCETFQNTKDNPEKEAALLERFKELLPQIEASVPHDPAKVFMGGVSGGGWRAFHYSAQIARPWAGIFANCSWVGDEKYWDLPYPAMRVAMVSGNNDYGRYSLEKDTEVLSKRGCTISVQAFEGGHQVAPPDVMTKAFRWLLGEIQ
jgi:predicted esterase